MPFDESAIKQLLKQQPELNDAPRIALLLVLSSNSLSSAAEKLARDLDANNGSLPPERIPMNSLFSDVFLYDISQEVQHLDADGVGSHLEDRLAWLEDNQGSALTGSEFDRRKFVLLLREFSTWCMENAKSLISKEDPQFRSPDWFLAEISISSDALRGRWRRAKGMIRRIPAPSGKGYFYSAKDYFHYTGEN
ncbi:MAG: hypothetical protein AAGI37_12535 [Planctomycetota bacterium]